MHEPGDVADSFAALTAEHGDRFRLAREIGTDWLHSYLALPNYADNLLRSGFSDDDLAQAGDRLFDAIIAWGRRGRHYAQGRRASFGRR